jgi:hypothetical protein
MPIVIWTTSGVLPLPTYPRIVHRNPADRSVSQGDLQPPITLEDEAALNPGG